MKPLTRCSAIGFAWALVLFAGTVRADEPTSPAPPPAPLPDDAPPPAVVRPAPPPVPGPYEPEHRDDTVIGSNVTHGGYGAPSLKVSTLAGDPVMFVGGEGGWIIGRAIVLGAAGYSSVTNVVSPATLQSPTGDARLGLSYGGFRFGGIVRPLARTHVTLGVLIGGGAATTESGGGSFRRSDNFWGVEPDVGAELNLAYHVRLGISGSYRFLSGTDAVGFNPSRLSGPAAALTLRFGQF